MKKIILSIVVLLFFMMGTKVMALSDNEEYLMNHDDPILPIKLHSGEAVTLSKDYVIEKQQLRGVYIYTNNNQDFNKSQNIEEFKQNYLSILSNIAKYNMNTVFFEVRPNNDAFYQSEYNPWSKFLTGTEGLGFDWDPLKWMIDVTHSKGMHFHAGFNLYQVSNPTELSKESYLNTLSEKNFAFLHPDYVLTTVFPDGKFQYSLNPGVQEVQDFILNSVMEIVDNYKVDAINIEDFFYPITPLNQYDDTNLFNQIDDVDLTIEDWRRNQVTDLIYTLHDEITHYNLVNDKYIQLGLTSYGVWNHASLSNAGSYTAGETSFSSEYADVRKWVDEEYVDYVAPQIEWTFEDVDHPYADLVKWWADMVSDTDVNLYISEKLNGEYKTSNQIVDQLRYNQNYHEIKGSVFNSYKSIISDEEITKLTLNKIATNLWNDTVLYPEIKTFGLRTPRTVERLLVKYISDYVKLSWQQSDDAQYYIVYRFENDEPIDLNNTSHIIQFVQPTKENKIIFVDRDISTDHIYKYFITMVDHAHQESKPVTFGISTYPNEMFNVEMAILIITSSIALSVIGISAYITLKRSK